MSNTKIAGIFAGGMIVGSAATLYGFYRILLSEPVVKFVGTELGQQLSLYIENALGPLPRRPRNVYANLHKTG